MRPKITVILLTCNRTAYVRQALEGLRKQTYPHWTLTASDCSFDPAARAEIKAILEEYRRNNPDHEIRIVQQPERFRQGEHLRRAMLGNNTPYVAFLDDDDVWMPNHLERACAWLDQGARHGLAISNGRIIDANGGEQGWTNSREDRLPDPGDQKGWLRLFMSSFFGSTSGYVFRQEALANHPFLPTPLVDVHVALSAALADYHIIGFSEPSYFYRIHGGSFYEKGSVRRDRNDLRLWLFCRQGLRIIWKFPLFLFLVLKSAQGKVVDAVADAMKKRGAVHKG